MTLKMLAKHNAQRVMQSFQIGLGLLTISTTTGARISFSFG
jgi:hypothetical protein